MKPFVVDEFAGRRDSELLRRMIREELSSEEIPRLHTANERA